MGTDFLYLRPWLAHLSGILIDIWKNVIFFSLQRPVSRKRRSTAQVHIEHFAYNNLFCHI